MAPHRRRRRVRRLRLRRLAEPAALRTVQQVTESALARIAAAPVALVCAGRTDAGVHALGRSRTSTPRRRAPCAAGCSAPTANCPPMSACRWALPVPRAFPCPLQRRGAHLPLPDPQPHRALGAARAARRLGAPAAGCGSAWLQAAALLDGEHDFSAFRAAECQAKSPVRRLERLSVQRRGDWVLHRGHRQRLPAPHGAQHRRPAHRHRARATRARLGGGGARRARPHARGAPPRRPRGCTWWRCATRRRSACPRARRGRAGARSAMIRGRNRRHASELNDVLVRKDHALAHQDRAAHALGPGGPVDQVPGLRCGALPRRAGTQPVRVPQVQPSHAHGCARAAGALPRPGHDRGDRREHLARGPAEVPRQQALPRPPGCRRRRRPGRAMR